MNRSILLFGAAREASSRCENKMLRPFADTTLFDIYLGKLARLARPNIFSRVVIAVSRSDAGLWTKAYASGVEVAERSTRSVARGILPRGEELEFLRRYDESHVMFLNGCIPMFPAVEVEQMARRFLQDESAESITMRRVEHDWFYREDGSPVNNLDPRCLSTQGCDPLLRAVHAANIYPRCRMLEENVRWGGGPGDPTVHVVSSPSWQMMDVDDEDDFDACEREYTYRVSRQEAA